MRIKQVIITCFPAVTVNDLTVNKENTVYAVTGYGGTSINAEAVTTTLTAIQNGEVAGSWTTFQGQKASSTGNCYGIYDLSDGLYEFVAGYIAEGNNYNSYSGNLKGESSEYKSKYAGINETCTVNYSTNPNTEFPFFLRGGLSGGTSITGVFLFATDRGYCYCWTGFRVVLVVK